MLETDKDRLTEKEKLMNITLDATQQKELKKMLNIQTEKERISFLSVVTWSE